MDSGLDSVAFTLVDLDDSELGALMQAACAMPETAPGLLAWIKGACAWELHRRKGFAYPLLPPEAAIDPSEDAVSIAAAEMLRARFAQDQKIETVVALFDAILEALSGGQGRR